ncbi:MAG: hypothetical protein JSS49_14085 [Planctomycetes bacterium]|nr:hypothetical protein [Planctomycetota bacterium]
MKSCDIHSLRRSFPATAMAARAGVTLSEVLVSMLLMSIGVVSLATLFPISVLRTAQATQLTHAVFLRNNAEAAIEANLGLLSNAQIGLNTVAVVDPIGFYDGLGGTLTGTTIPRTNGGTGNLAYARQLAGLPDSWKEVIDDKVASFTATSATVPTAFSGAAPSSIVNYRAVLVDATGKLAVIRTITGVAGTTVSWASPLPSGFTPARLRLEVQETKYSYILTVRKLSIPTVLGDTSWEAEIDVAVFFGRSNKPADETPVAINLPSLVKNGLGFDNANGVSGVDDDANGSTDDASELGWPGSDDNRTIQVTSGTPFLKKGSYMLETSMLKWYRIVNFNSSTGMVLLDRDIRVTSATASAGTSSAIFMKGIVDVFPLGSRTGQQ